MTVLATDLDRTLIPNGHDEFNGDMPTFFETVETAGLDLWYVTGRSLEQFREGQENYDIRDPEYLLSEVGTVVYRYTDNGLQQMPEWVEHVRSSNPGWDTERIREVLPLEGGVRLQEENNQNEFKVSLYVDDHDRKDELIEALRENLTRLNVNPEIIWSFDPLKDNVGLLDILAGGATKLGALEFLREYNELTKDDIVFAGDSGNDLLALTFGYYAIVVHNAPDEVKEEVCAKNTEQDLMDRTYIAEGDDESNGNYSSGILEGLRHFEVI